MKTNEVDRRLQIDTIVGGSMSSEILDWKKMKGVIPTVVQNADTSVRELRYCTNSRSQANSLEKILGNESLPYVRWVRKLVHEDIGFKSWQYCPEPYKSSFDAMLYDCDGDALLCLMPDNMPTEFNEVPQPGKILNIRPVVVQEASTSEVLTVAYVNWLALQSTIRTGEAAYYSRSQKGLWVKGAKSGNKQLIENIFADSGQTTFLYQVSQLGEGACHNKNPEGRFYRSCFYRRLL